MADELSYKSDDFVEYRSTYRVQAQRLYWDELPDDEVLELSDGTTCMNGDYLVQHPDGKVETMPMATFEEQFGRVRNPARVREVKS